MRTVWRSSRGDTIVEVLIAITVISFVLGGAYVVANHSYNNMRQAQERSEALKFVQEQLERIKANAPTNPNLFSQPGNFCVDASNNIQVQNPTITAVNCQENNLYNMTVSRSGNAATGYTFTVKAIWPEFGGKVNDNVSVLYKVET